MDHERRLAEHMKMLGNAAFKKSLWDDAVEAYRSGVEAVDAMIMSPADDVKCACLSNMAAALIKLGRCEIDREQTHTNSCRFSVRLELCCASLSSKLSLCH